MNKTSNSKYLLLIVCIFSFLVLDAQILTHRQGVYVFQLTENSKYNALEERLERFGDFEIQPVAEKFKVFELHFDFFKFSNAQIGSILSMQPEIAHYSLDYFVSNRLQPNDSQYSDQWYFGPSGSFGINMEEAWSYSTGGVTATGDTIVVAILDDDFDDTHPDLVDNLWRNNQEIPNNGLDDDGNGYVDDYRGWNTNLLTDSLKTTSFSHGTRVVGLLGAQGNNGTGITGVNWDTKIMLVSNNTGTSTNVIRGYSYIYEMRKLYNETNGAKGAFVVASNSSFGIEDRFAEDFPIWCSLYDSLGSVGVLNISSTTNRLKDVGIRGDMPSTCPSDYLVVVSGSKNDGTFDRRGFSQTFIDLLAPTKGILTLNPGNDYITDDGTSLATPMVTGAIGLLYSGACPNLVDLAKKNPVAAVELSKKKLLESVNKQAGLDIYAVTGGILDVGKLMANNQDSCRPCFEPFDINISVEADEANLTWDQLSLVDSVTIQLTNLSTNVVTSFSSSTRSISIPLPDDCTPYAVQLEASCITGTSVTVIDTLESKGCCRNPDNFRSNSVISNAVNLVWPSEANITGYEVRYRREFANEWDTVKNITTGTTNINGLEPCTTYEFQLRTFCPLDTLSFGESTQVSTPGCGSCTEIDYCTSRGVGTNAEYIDSVIIGSQIFVSGDDANGYRLTENSNLRFDACSAVPVTVKFKNPSGDFPESVSIWVDFNQNGVFEDEERLLASPSTRDSVTTVLNIPDDFSNGNTRMRISLKFIGNDNTAFPRPCEQITLGEVEDYCVTLAGASPPCDELEIDVRLEQGNRALFLYMEDDLDFTNLTLQYRQSNTSNDLETYRLVGRSPFVLPYEIYDRCVSYDFFVEAQCGCQEALLTSNTSTAITPCNVNNEAAKQADIKLFPNPNNGQFRVNGLSGLKDISIKVYTIDGKLVQEQFNANGDEVEIILLNGAERGLYILNISNDSINFNKKFILN